MGNKIKIFILEEASVSNNKTISCYTKRFRPGGTLALITKYYTFANEEDFSNSANNIITLINHDSEADLYFFIISSHGEELTGTHLGLPNNNSINPHYHQHLFRNIRKNMVIFLSACWGGYPAPISAMTSSRHFKPIFIAPLVPIDGAHNKEIQNGITDILLKEKESEQKLIKFVSNINNKYRTHYLQYSLRIVDRNGNWFPGQSESGLASEIQNYKIFRIAALQKQPNVICNAPIRAILWDGEYYWECGTGKFLRQSNFKDYYNELIGDFVKTRYQIRTDAKTTGYLGQIDIFGNAKFIDKKHAPKNIWIHSYKYPHNTLPSDNLNANVKTETLSIGSPCISCNWAFFTWKTLCPDIKIIDRFCYYADCSENIS